MKVVKVTDIPGIKIGNAQDLEAKPVVPLLSVNKALLPVLMSGAGPRGHGKLIYCSRRTRWTKSMLSC